MMGKIGRELISVDQYKRELAALGEAVEGEDATVTEGREEFEGKLVRAEKMITAIDGFHGEITKHWSTTNQRVSDFRRYQPQAIHGGLGSD